jgi:hypothetical protein
MSTAQKGGLTGEESCHERLKLEIAIKPLNWEQCNLAKYGRHSYTKQFKLFFIGKLLGRQTNIFTCIASHA